MIALFAIIALFFVLLLFLIFTPITLQIDTYRHLYALRVWGVTSCFLVWKDGILLEVKVPFYRFTIDPFTLGSKIKKRKAKRRQKVEKKTAYNKIKKGVKVLQSFKLTAFRLDLDTSDVLWNAYLYPVFFFLHSQKTPLHINYEGRTGLLLCVENSGARMLRAFFF